MLAIETHREYRAWIEYRVLRALEARAIEYLADVTRIVTEAVCDLGKRLGFAVTLEKRYHPILMDGRNRRCDVHWQGEIPHVWEIDRSLKEISANKLSAAAEAEKMWVLWAKEADMASLRLMDLAGINIIVLSPDIRKLIWDRLLFEKFARSEMRDALARDERFLRVRRWEEKPGRES